MLFSEEFRERKMIFSRAFGKTIAYTLTVGLVLGLPQIADGQTPYSGPVVSPFVQSLIAAVPAEPLTAIPERWSAPGVAGTWTAGVVVRMIELDRKAMNFDFFTTATLLQSQLFPALLALAGDAQGLAKTRQTWETRNSYSLGKPLPSQCEGSSGMMGCVAVAERFATALLALATGDREAAEKWYEGTMQEEVLLRSMFADTGSCYFGRRTSTAIFYCDRILSLRAHYEAQSGRIERAAETIRQWIDAVKDTASEDRDHQLLWLNQQLSLLLTQGRLRDAVQLAYLASTDRTIRFGAVADFLFEALRHMSTTGAPVEAQTAVLALAAKVPDAFPTAQAGWKGHFNLALECSAQHIAVQSGKSDPEMAKQFERALRLYLDEDSDSREIGFCLYTLAPRIGLAARQSEIAGDIQSKWKRSEARVRNFLQKMIQQRRGDAEAVKVQTALLPARAILYSSPKGVYLIDEKKIEDGLIGSLDAMKTVDATYRAFEQPSILFLALYRHRFAGSNY